MLKTLLVFLWAPFANLLWYTHTVVMGSLSLLLWPFDRTGALQFWCARWWCRLVAWSIFARILVHGVEHVRAGQPYVYMANHSSLIDTPALFAYLPYPFRIMAKRELFFVPFMGWHLWTAGHFPIDRRDRRKTVRSLRRVIEGVRNGKSLAVFPEGTRTRVQAYEGVCIARKGGSGIGASFTVRKISFGEGVERVFPLYSTNIDAIEVVRRGKVRRAKLYYLRDRRGKSARIAEKTNYKPKADA